MGEGQELARHGQTVSPRPKSDPGTNQGAYGEVASRTGSVQFCASFNIATQTVQFQDLLCGNIKCHVLSKLQSLVPRIHKSKA